MDPAAQPRGPVGGHHVAWVRRCTGCGRDDLRSAYGGAAIPADRWWSCPGCGSGDAVPRLLEWPAGGGGGRCPSA